jgi:predicted ABC-class ATPase
VEGIEAGSRVFLLDEDTSATNFMVRDELMQRIICREKEPITPFLERAKELYDKAGISTILVAGSSGAFFHIADTIIQMDSYRPVDITLSTKELCRQYPLPDVDVPEFHLPVSHRIMTRNSSSPERRHGSHRRDSVSEQSERIKVKTRGTDGFSLDKQEVDLRYLEQIVDAEQMATLGLLLKYACQHLIDGKRTIPEIVTYLEKELADKGLAFLEDNGAISGGYAMPRVQEIYSCFNRYRR